MRSFFQYAAAIAFCASTFANASALPNLRHSERAASLAGYNIVNLRIEGTNTIYEAPIFSGPRNVTTPSGGTHLCDGTNDAANPTPGNTCTDALDAASKLLRFPFDGTYDAEFQDFFITSIGGTTETATEFWGLLLNYQFTPVGGCQQEVKPGDHVLWAFNAFNAAYFLKAEPEVVAILPGKSAVVTVTDGTTGVPVAGAEFAGQLTNAQGQVTVTGKKPGVNVYKATRSDSIRSNAVVVTII
ncbi:hypothetical protein MMC26_001594 [Xylographa opegraphella]|nr:hypothetical protein [Xylographa opegraphella]